MHKTTVLAAGPPSEAARGLAARLGADLVSCDVAVFPDGESKLTLPKTPAGRCIVVQSMGPPADTNLVRLLSLVHAARDHADDATAVIPYMGYARQDREFLAGEVVTIRVVADLLRGAGAGRVLTVDMHSAAGLRHFDDITNLTAIPELAAHFGAEGLDDPLAVSPDAGGRERADLFARALGIDSASLDKERDRRTGTVAIRNDGMDVAGRDVVLVDDMISTGGSMVEATSFLRRQGCGRVFVACTHALLVGGAAKKIMDAGAAKIVSTNTVPNTAAVVDVSGIVHRALEKKQ